MPSVESFAIFPNTIVKIRVVISGLIRYHKGPRMVCLYVVKKFLFTNSQTSSRDAKSSPRFKSKILFFGRITV